MEIYLLRHGLAAERDAFEFKDDSQRPLTARGKKQLRNVSATLRKLKLDFDLILSSPFKRTRETAMIVANDLKLARRLEFSETLTPEKDVRLLIQRLQKTKPAPKQILVVGHEPFLGQLISLLTTGDLALQIDFKKGGLAKLESKKLTGGRCATLTWLLTPKQMKWIG
ncbi:MAG TPA: phosphohistidine phosphatase SixA [Verrucomicrobiae bacterium]|jgi:phosphohistidine phosphatase